MSDYQFIRQFTEINIKNICSDLHLEKSYYNIMNGTASKKKLNKVRQEIERRLKIMYENN